MLLNRPGVFDIGNEALFERGHDFVAFCIFFAVAGILLVVVQIQNEELVAVSYTHLTLPTIA